MAGSDQSVNLSGMLSGIGNTLGSMGAVGGIYADSFAQALKPQIDPKDPESYMAAAKWASNNNRPDEAASYRKEASALSLQQTEKGLADNALKINQRAMKLEERGRLSIKSGNADEFSQVTQGLAALAQDPTATADDVDRIREIIKDLSKEGNRNQLKSNAAFGNAKAAANLIAAAKNPEVLAKAGEDGVAKLEAKADELLQKEGALEQYNAYVAEESKKASALREEQDRVEVEADLAALREKIQQKDYDGAESVIANSRFSEELKPVLAIQKSLLDIRALENDQQGVETMGTLVSNAIEGLKKYKSQGSEAVVKDYEESLATIQKIKDPRLQEGQLKNLLSIIAAKAEGYTTSALAAEQAHITWQREHEGTIAASRPDKDLMDEFDEAQKVASSYSDRFNRWVTGKGLDSQDKRNAEKDYRRATLGLATEHYAFDSESRMIFDDKGNPVAAPPGYLTAAQIGQGLRNSVTGKRAVSREQYDALDPKFQHQVYIDNTL